MPRAEVDLRSWSAERIEAAQLLYGEGWLSPGGEALYAELTQCLLLDANQTVVQHGAGLGGLARMIARDSEAWIEAQEASPLLSAEAIRLNKAAGLGKKVEVLAAPMEGGRFKPGSRHAVVSCEALYRAPDKAAELAALCAMLKPGGQLLLTDFIRKGAGADAVARWARCEASEPHFIPADELRALLENQGLDVRVFEDRSQDFCRCALADLQALLKRMESAPVRQSMRGWLVWEIEVLTQKLQAIDSGAIGFQRVFALAGGQRIDR
jgi:cyclopropane fatty-acyl-phospholipid synthase-like methyltransferase